jgi:hypothetical protein
MVIEARYTIWFIRKAMANGTAGEKLSGAVFISNLFYRLSTGETRIFLCPPDLMVVRRQNCTRALHIWAN